MASSSKKITVTIADGSGKACRMQIKADATVEDLAARYGRFRARASEADDDADPPRFRLHRDDGEALKPTLAASALDDGAMVSLLSWVQSDAGFAPNRKEKLGLA